MPLTHAYPSFSFTVVEPPFEQWCDDQEHARKVSSHPNSASHLLLARRKGSVLRQDRDLLIRDGDFLVHFRDHAGVQY